MLCDREKHVKELHDENVKGEYLKVHLVNVKYLGKDSCVIKRDLSIPCHSGSGPSKVFAIFMIYISFIIY